eukprot:3489861-Pleurochrysis_carterae.AAC.1
MHEAFGAKGRRARLQAAPAHTMRVRTHTRRASTLDEARGWRARMLTMVACGYARKRSMLSAHAQCARGEGAAGAPTC